MPKKSGNQRGIPKAVVTELQRTGGKISHADKPTRASGRRAARIANKMEGNSSSTGRDKSSARKRSTGGGRKKQAA
jgi:hypothetical protein